MKMPAEKGIGRREGGKKNGALLLCSRIRLVDQGVARETGREEGEVKMSRFSRDDVFGRCGVGFFGAGRRTMHDAPSKNNRCCLREMGSRAVVR